jgi:hypothetical protein
LHWSDFSIRQCAQITPKELLFELLPLKLSAHRSVALWMAIPIGMVLLAVAWRIVRRAEWQSSFDGKQG